MHAALLFSSHFLNFCCNLTFTLKLRLIPDKPVAPVGSEICGLCDTIYGKLCFTFVMHIIRSHSSSLYRGYGRKSKTVCVAKLLKVCYKISGLILCVTVSLSCESETQIPSIENVSRC